MNILSKSVENNVLIRFMFEEQLKTKLIVQDESALESDIDEQYKVAMEKLRPIIREEMIKAFQDVIKK